MRNLEGRTAVVTGAASGMGRAFAQRFGAAGMRVVLADVEGPALDRACTELQSAGIEAHGILTDVSNERDLQRLKDGALEQFGSIDLVCLNAGVGGGNGPMDTLSTADWQWVLNVNLWGVIHGISAFLPHLKAQDDGHIVITASIAGLTSFPNMGPYNVTKHSAVAIAETLFSELRDQRSHVGVSCLCPGVVRTNINSSERNRPEALRRPLIEQELTDEQNARRQASVEIFTQAKPPHEVADLVHEAVVNNSFWIFTDEVYTPAIRDRATSIIERTDPVRRGTLLDVYFT